MLGLFGGPILPNYQTGEPLSWYWWIVSFYSGIGFVIIGTVLLIAARNVTAMKETDTPARIEEQSMFRRMRLSHFPIDVGIALLAGVVSLAVNTFVAWAPSTGSSGFPFPVRSVIPGCFGPGYPLGCLAYDPLQLVLDGAFWTGLAFAVVAFADLITTLLVTGVGESARDTPKSTV